MHLTESNRLGDRLQIALCIDKAFFRHALVTAVSLLNSGQSRPFDLHIYYAESDPLCVAEIERIFRQQERHTCTLSPICLDAFQLFPVSDSISASTYARLLLPQLMPQADKVLYLDADLVVRDDLSALWNLDLRAHAVAAVLDPFCDNRVAIGFGAGDAYFNAGVLLMNIDVWRRENLAEAVANYVIRFGPLLKYFDQDALNAVLKHRVLFVDPRWNFQPRMADIEPRVFACTPEAFGRARASPAIIHYTTPHKPWKDPFSVHYGRTYLDCLEMVESDLRSRYFKDVPRRRRFRISHWKTQVRWQFPQTYRTVRSLYRAARGTT
jgi:lipopolysaccharide biosynthesis glycosyltransferase